MAVLTTGVPAAAGAPAPGGRTTTAPRRLRRGAGRGLVVVLRTVALTVPVFLIATFLTFALRALSGLSPARLQLGESATPEVVARIEASWGLDRPFLEQYWTWFTGVLHGDLGTSWSTGADVSLLLAQGLTISLTIALVALVIGVLLGIALGTVAALRRGTWLDRAVTGFCTLLSVMPPFVVGIVLVTVFAVALGWFPSGGYEPLSAGLGPWLAHITLPALALSFDVVAETARQLRSGLVAAYRENFVTGAIVRGVPPRRVFLNHALRTAAGPTLATLGIKAPVLIGGAVVTEWIFGLQGFGRYANDAAQSGDVPAVQGVLVVAIVVVVGFNLLVNLVLAKVNPAAGRGV